MSTVLPSSNKVNIKLNKVNINLPFDIIKYIFDFVPQDENLFAYTVDKQSGKIFCIPNKPYVYMVHEQSGRICYIPNTRILGPRAREILDKYPHITARNVFQFDYEFAKILLEINGLYLEHVPGRHSEILCKIAIKSNWMSLQHVRLQTEEVCKFAIRKNSSALNFVRHQTEDLLEEYEKQFNYENEEYEKQFYSSEDDEELDEEDDRSEDTPRHWRRSSSDEWSEEDEWSDSWSD